MRPKRPSLSALLGPGKPLPSVTSVEEPKKPAATPAKRAARRSTAPKAAPKAAAPAPAPTATAAAAPARDTTPPAGRKPGRRRSGYEQLNVLVPSEMRREAKIRAIRESRDLSDIVAELLATWLRS